MDEDHIWRTDEQGVGVIEKEYFFIKKIATSNPSNVDEVLNVVDGVVTKEMN